MNTGERVAKALGVVYRTEVGSFVRYRVDPPRAGFRPGTSPRSRATVQAQGRARDAGLKVLDVTTADEQEGGAFIVGLRVGT